MQEFSPAPIDNITLYKVLGHGMQGMTVGDMECFKDMAWRALGVLCELMEASDDVIRLVACDLGACLGAIGGLISAFTSFCANAEGRGGAWPSEKDASLLEVFADLATRLDSDADQMSLEILGENLLSRELSLGGMSCLPGFCPTDLGEATQEDSFVMLQKTCVRLKILYQPALAGQPIKEYQS